MGQLIREEAERLNVDYMEVVTRIVSEHYGLPATNDIEPAGQEPLRMTG